MEKDNLALSMEQMQHLLSLGIKADGATMVYHPNQGRSDVFRLERNTFTYSREFWDNPKRKALAGDDIFERLHGRDVFAFTTADLMMILPESITISGIPHSLLISKKKIDDVTVYIASYSFVDASGKFISKRNDTYWESAVMVQLLHSVLLWLMDNKFVNPKEIEL